MKLINSNYEIIEPVDYSLENLYKFVELCGRVCYKSEDRITSDSATKFIDRMIKSGHTSTLEHGTIYLYREFDSNKLEEQDYHGWTQTYIDNPYSVISTTYRTNGVYQVYVTTNYRVIIENALEDDLQYIVDQPMDSHERRYTVRFIMDRIGSQSFCRHRHFSFSQESTRYCNYSKDKFDNEIKYIIPTWLNIPEGKYTYWDGDWVDTDKMKINIPDEGKASSFLFTLNHCEMMYNSLINQGCKAQEARQVLPNALKTELIMTGFASDWQHFFDLRDDSKAHPDAQKLAHDLHNEFKRRHYVGDWINVRECDDLFKYTQSTIIN